MTARLPGAGASSLVEHPPPLLLLLQMGPTDVTTHCRPFGQPPHGFGVGGMAVGDAVGVGDGSAWHMPSGAMQCWLAGHELVVQHTWSVQKLVVQSLW